MSSPLLNRAVGTATARGPWRYFVVVLGFRFVGLSIAGFAPSFFRGPPAPPLAMGPGVLMTAWWAVFITQARLVSPAT